MQFVFTTCINFYTAQIEGRVSVSVTFLYSSFSSGNAGDGLTRSNNMEFSTADRDNDGHEINCAEKERGGWWYASCGDSNLNGIYYR